MNDDHTKNLKIGDPWPFESARGLVGAPCEPAWYALITRPQKERQTRHRLQNAGCVVRYPTTERTRHVRGQKITIVTPVIPRIIYARFKYEPQWDVMRDRRVIVGVFSRGDMPIELTNDQVAEVMDLPSTIIQLEDEKLDAIRPRVGEPAKLTGGPFKGFFVDVTRVESGRVWYEMAIGGMRMKGEDSNGLVQRVAE